MTKLDILKKLNLIKYVNTNGLNGEKYYSTNTNSPLFWIIYVLFWVVCFVPLVLFAIYGGILLVFSTEHNNLLRLFDSAESGKGRDKLTDLLPE